jgi:hypothetical protein
MPKYSIIEAVIIKNPDFDNLDLLAKQIYKNVVQVSDEFTDLLKNT